MYATVATTPVFLQRVKPMMIAGLLALSLMVGAGGAAHQVGAATPQTGTVVGCARNIL